MWVGVAVWALWGVNGERAGVGRSFESEKWKCNEESHLMHKVREGRGNYSSKEFLLHIPRQVWPHSK